MSAINSNAGEREGEALRRAQRAHEPSMEEILASIRGIIAEERKPRSPGSAAFSRSSTPAAPPVSAHAEKSKVEPVAPAGGEELMAAETEEAVMAAFATLSAGLRARSAELAEAMVRELIRPMLKAWLDENLPSLVERLVRSELDRISRPFR